MKSRMSKYFWKLGRKSNFCHVAQFVKRVTDNESPSIAPPCKSSIFWWKVAESLNCWVQSWRETRQFNDSFSVSEFVLLVFLKWVVLKNVILRFFLCSPALLIFLTLYKIKCFYSSCLIIHNIVLHRYILLQGVFSCILSVLTEDTYTCSKQVYFSMWDLNIKYHLFQPLEVFKHCQSFIVEGGKAIFFWIKHWNYRPSLCTNFSLDMVLLYRT